MKAISLLCIFLVLLFGSCAEKEQAAPTHSEARKADESRGRDLLASSRQALLQGNYERARQLIDTLRQCYPLALNAREDAIILADSIHILEAQSILQHLDRLQAAGNHTDSLRKAHDEAVEKLNFYRRKAQHDRSHRQSHP